MSSLVPLTSKQKVLAIIITYNPEFEHLNNFVSILSKQFFSILVIDNCSDKFDLNLDDHISENCYIHLINNISNIGLASAQNQGVIFAIDNNFESICIFDQDSSVEANYLDTMFSDYNLLISKGEAVGAIGPCVVDKGSGVRYPISIYNGFFLNRYQLNENEIANCSYIISSGSLISVDTLISVGFFLDKFFINYIDIEWCFRAIHLNKKVFTTNNTFITQDVGLYRKSVFGRFVPVHGAIRRYYAARNSVFMLKLPHVSIGYKLREVIFNPLRLIFDCIVAGNSFYRSKYFFKGLYHGIINK
jgi:rhamnosyltransferase